MASDVTKIKSVWAWKARRGGMLPTNTVFSTDFNQAETTIVLTLIFPAAVSTGTLVTRKLLLGVGR